jgi:hypothetical protein
MRRRQKLISCASPDLGPEELGPQRRDLGHGGGDVELAPVLYLRMEVCHVGAVPSESLAQRSGKLLFQLHQVSTKVQGGDGRAPGGERMGHAEEVPDPAGRRKWG